MNIQNNIPENTEGEEHLVFTDEMKQQLKGFLAIEPEAKFEYVPKAWRKKKVDKEGNELPEYEIPKQFWPVFVLEGRNGIEVAEVEDKVGYWSSKGDFHSTSGKGRLEVLQSKIKGWTNYRNGDGVLIPFRHNNGLMKRECLKTIHPVLQIELLEAINERNTLTSEELEGLDSWQAITQKR